ncbi:hypothetical protein HIM_08622 [Hirsutella minnesotensis 3608]|uniref:Uncharacterized protein n=1 Tax=Hirsutella minnesotensis 3608 TaxID=1043627 RepID=A0A0F8A3K6_9HYPO|nr:hypothetical protein HIM_08622 [Hirsutella minnesotensis 3608]
MKSTSVIAGILVAGLASAMVASDRNTSRALDRRAAGDKNLPICNGKSAFDIPGETCQESDTGAAKPAAGKNKATAAKPAANNKNLPLCNGKSAFDIPGETCQESDTGAAKPAAGKNKATAAKPAANNKNLPICNGKSAFDIPGENCRNPDTSAAGKTAKNGTSAKKPQPGTLVTRPNGSKRPTVA